MARVGTDFEDKRESNLLIKIVNNVGMRSKAKETVILECVGGDVAL